VVSDQDRSRDYYTTVFGARVLRDRDPVILQLANTWLILNDGGDPTADKPTVTLTTPPDPDTVSAFLNIRVRRALTRGAWPSVSSLYHWSECGRLV
jgi:lactoylglutathione lyase